MSLRVRVRLTAHAVVRRFGYALFFAHDKTKESENPSVAFFTEDQMTSKIDSGIESGSDDDALFRPYTFTTPGMEEQDQPDLGDLLDEVE